MLKSSPWIKVNLDRDKLFKLIIKLNLNWHGWPMMGPMELHLRLYFTRNPCHSDHRSLVHISSMSSSCHELHVFILNKSLRWYYRSLWWVIISERKWWVIGGTNWPIKIRMKHKLFSIHILSINYSQYIKTRLHLNKPTWHCGIILYQILEAT